MPFIETGAAQPNVNRQVKKKKKKLTINVVESNCYATTNL